MTMPNCDTECTNIFLEKRSEQYPDDIILLVCDGAAWHKSKALRCPENIQLLSIPPYTPEMNPIEQIWKQIRSMGFRNEVFNSLDDVMNRLCETICMVSTGNRQRIQIGAGKQGIQTIFISDCRLTGVKIFYAFFSASAAISASTERLTTSSSGKCTVSNSSSAYRWRRISHSTCASLLTTTFTP